MITFAALFGEGKEPSLYQVLANKEQRIEHVTKLLTDNPQAVVCVLKCNIPGPIKTNANIVALFKKGATTLQALLVEHEINIMQAEELNIITGPEGFYLIEHTEPTRVKEIAILFETEKLGRLFDADIYYLDENKHLASMSRTELGAPLRRCFICEQPAKQCAGRRVHQVEALQQKIVEILNVEGNEQK